MSEEQNPRHWIGSAVLLTTGPALQTHDMYETRQVFKYGTLQDVSLEGVVLYERTYITWQGPDYNPEEGTGGGREYRLVYQFYPWHMVYAIRPLEEEEKRDQELYQ